MANIVVPSIPSSPPPTQTRNSHAPSQTRITDFFASNQLPKPTPSPRATFHDLPPNVRQLIYEAAGFGGNQFIDLNLWTVRNLDERWHNEDGQPLNPSYLLEDGWRETYDSAYLEEPFPSALLWAGSRLVHDEVQTKLYSENTFAVSLLGSHGLHPLEMLSDAALRELRVLIVSMCPCQCLTPYCSKLDIMYHGDDLFWDRPTRWDFWESAQNHITDDYHTRPLGCTSRTDKRILAQWERICDRLAVNSRPRQLSLYLVANIANPHTAIRFLQPLANMPMLKDMAINLGHHIEHVENPNSRTLIRQIVKTLTGDERNQPFRFLDLPLELQIKILQETSLVSTADMKWTPAQRLGQSSFGPDCWARESLIRNGYYSKEITLRETLLTTTIFCSLEHPTAFGNKCHCRSSPLEYFLVSKAFSAAARAVFYRNKFNLQPTKSSLYKISGDWMDEYQLSLPSFLRCIPRGDIVNLRHLCVIFPPFMPDYLRLPLDQPQWDEWVGSIEFLAQLADLSRLKIEIHFSEQSPLPMEEEASHLDSLYAQWRARRDAEAEKNMLDAYKRLLDPLRNLGPDLSALLVYVSWPLYEAAHEQRKADERLLERMIMGEEYDSTKWGKLDKSPYSQPRRFNIRHDG